MTELVIGWEGIARVMGFNEDIIRRWCRLYGFPQPVEAKHKKKWNRAEVLKWVDNNQEFINSERERCNNYGNRRFKSDQGTAQAN